MAGSHLTRPAVTTSRLTTELLSLPAPFSQVGLLDPEGFVVEAKKRRYDLDVARLQELHRLGILTPFFRVDLSSKSHATGPTPVSAELRANQFAATVIQELVAAAERGTLADAAEQPFESWPTSRVRMLWPSVQTGYLYSHHQLLQLQTLRPILQRFVPFRTAAGDVGWKLPRTDRPTMAEKQAMQTWRSFAIILTAIDTEFWPTITRVLVGDEQNWRAAHQNFDAAVLATWLNIEATTLREQAQALLSRAENVDVLGDFYDVVRRARSKSWDSLRGPALEAMDLRLAAEVLFMFTDKLGVDAQEYEPPLARQRLSQRPQSSDAVLNRLQLSPHPALILALEGDTEMVVMPHVLDFLGIPRGGKWMQLVDFEGTKDLSLLARYAAEPRVGGVRGEWLSLERPVTRFLVLTDAENNFATIQKRNRQRRLLLKSITKNIPTEFRQDLLKRSNAFVEIRTWGPLPFEFAHFTDRELAQALLTASARDFPGGEPALRAALAKQRVSPKPSVHRAWPLPQSGVTKPQLAAALLPLLDRKMTRALNGGKPGPMIMRHALRAYELATLDMGKNIVLAKNV